LVGVAALVAGTSALRMSSALYRALCRTGDKIVYPLLPPFAKTVWNHEAGPKTVFFWAPTIKWCLVLAGIADLKRPAEKLSAYQVPFVFDSLSSSLISFIIPFWLTR
uniref:Mitochondrial pyruvate carrier n=1 Tax=Gongylonema pulchrum TaxID=637853 RepID=A0A183DBL4_9BILA